MSVRLRQRVERIEKRVNGKRQIFVVAGDLDGREPGDIARERGIDVRDHAIFVILEPRHPGEDVSISGGRA